MSWLSKAISRNKSVVSTALALVPGVGGIASKAFDAVSKASGSKKPGQKSTSTEKAESKRFKVDGKFIVGD